MESDHLFNKASVCSHWLADRKRPHATGGTHKIYGRARFNRACVKSTVSSNFPPHTSKQVQNLSLTILAAKIRCFSDACGIELSDRIIITGGRDPGNNNERHARVISYDIDGNHQDYPPLLAWRTDHGCGYYRNSAQKLVRNKQTLEGLKNRKVEMLYTKIKSSSHMTLF